jgi:hypothetical protein
MKNIFRGLCSALCAAGYAVAADAAGTYYTGGTYQSPQTWYSAGGASPTSYNSNSNRYNANPYSGAQYQRPAAAQVPYAPVNAQQQSSAAARGAQAPGGKNSGFYISGGISRQAANWEFTMKQAGSKLSYDNLSWNVLDVNAGYAFGSSAFGLKIDAGMQYGMQAGESPMFDDDISAGGFWLETYYDVNTGNVIGDVVGHAISIGKSSGGSLMGFNVGMGLTDKFAIGRMKITPSIGYRTMSYSLTTESNYGLSLDTGYCITVPGTDEVQCNPFLVVENANQTPQVIWDNMNTSGGMINTGGTYYYSQPGKSHKYDVSWNGPYAALDLDYEINAFNAVSARVEVGLPAYTATGDQPYRPDWKHPKSVEDTAGFGDAYHLGLAALWATALTDSLSLQIGFTYDYYTVGGASAKTFMNGNAYGVAGYPAGTPYDTIYWDIVNNKFGGSETAALDPTTGNAMAIGIKDLRDSCPGWTCTVDGEVDSYYKSMGIRVGIAGRF